MGVCRLIDTFPLFLKVWSTAQYEPRETQVNRWSVRGFFGSWYDIAGRRQTGYYVEHELIKRLEATMSLKEIALLSGDDHKIVTALNSIAHVAWQPIMISPSTR